MLRRMTFATGVVVFFLATPVLGAVIKLELPAEITRATAERPALADVENIRRLEDDGDVYVDGSYYGRVEEDGDIYIDGSYKGRVEEDGDIYLDGSYFGRARGLAFYSPAVVAAYLIFFGGYL